MKSSSIVSSDFVFSIDKDWSTVFENFSWPFIPRKLSSFVYGVETPAEFGTEASTWDAIFAKD